MTDTTTTPAVPVSDNIASGLALVEAAITFFETVEGTKYLAVTKVLNAVLMLARML